MIDAADAVPAADLSRHDDQLRPARPRMLTEAVDRAHAIQARASIIKSPVEPPVLMSPPAPLPL